MIEKLDGFRMPAEWEPQKSIWIAWPYNKKDWPDLFYFIPKVVAKIVKAISEDQKVDLLINKDKQQVLKILKFYQSIEKCIFLTILDIMKNFISPLVILALNLLKLNMEI